MAADAIHGRRILVVEDDMMIAILIEDMLLDLGCAVAGPCNTLAGALALAGAPEPIDAAILDIDLDGVAVFPVADVLRARGVPIIYSTGFGGAALPPQDAACPVLQKPFRARAFEATLRAALAPPPEG